MSEVYKQAGVDVEKGYEAVERMKKHIAKTTRPEVMGGIGSFAGLFDLSSFTYKEPVMVSGTDGVGTKLKLAFELNKHDSVGIDLVAMCANDIVAQGAQPLFFLDYIACGKNDPAMIEQIVAGISNGCVTAGAALVGGETAEMPGMYEENEYDLAGFVVGIAEKTKLITGEAIKAGDIVIGLASNGIHSNGYSLVRKIIEQLDLNSTYHGLSASLGETVMTPTKIYAKPVAAVLKEVTVKGISHITGGGFYENIPRMLPDGITAKINKASYEVPAIFKLLAKTGGISEQMMYYTYNMGVGMMLAIEASEAEKAIETINAAGYKSFVCGSIIDGEKGITIE